jgi:hypothetical protein
MADGLFGTGARIAPLRQTPIQPTGIPGSTYVRPQERQVGGNVQRLAEALGSLNSNLQNIGAVISAQEDDPNSRANREWIAKRQQMSADQLREEAKKGTPNGVRAREDALNALLGERANDDFRKKWLEYYNTEFDQTSGDANAEYQRMRAEYAEALPTEIARGNFYRLTDEHHRAWMEKDAETKVTYVKQQVNTTVVDGFRNSVDDARHAGKSAQEAAAMVFAKSASNRDFLGLSGQEQNDTIYRLAEEYALNGDEDMAKALLEGIRKGADGKPLPPLMKIAGYTDKAIRLLDQAGDMRIRKMRKDGLGSFMADDVLVLRGAFTEEEAKKRKGAGLYSDVELANMVDRSNHNRATIEHKAAQDAQRRKLRVQSDREEQGVYAQAFNQMDRLGGINRVHDVGVSSPTGEGTRTVSKQAIIDHVIDLKEDAFNEQQETLVANGTDPATAKAQVDRMRVDWYAGNNVANKSWQNTLNGIAGRATTDTLLQKGEVSAYMKQSAALYRQLKSVNPAYLSTILTDKKSREFLEAYDTAVNHRKMPEDEALVHAALWTAKPEAEKARSMMPHADADKLATKTLKSIGSSWLPLSGGGLDARNVNYQYAMSRIEEMSLNGATEEEIKDNLESEILDTSVPINGVLVFANRDLPNDFPDLMQGELDKRFKDLGAKYGITDPSDLYVVADGSESKWYVVSKSRPGLLIGADPITSGTLEKAREERRVAHEGEIRKMAVAKDEERVEIGQKYKDQVAADRQKIRYWRNLAETRKGARKTLAEGVANELQWNLDQKLAGDMAVLKQVRRSAGLEYGKDQKRAAERQTHIVQWFRSLLPEVTIGDKTVLDGWNLKK